MSACADAPNDRSGAPSAISQPIGTGAQIGGSGAPAPGLAVTFRDVMKSLSG
jgi:hypothetical protein